MSTPDEWATAYARQAAADFRTWEILRATQGVHECQRLLFLQMACEKICKAHLIRGGTPPEALQASHGYVAGPLPILIRQFLISINENVANMAYVLTHCRQLANEIEVLNPAVKRDEQRPDNCEYPWEDGNAVVRSPLDWTFLPSQLLMAQAGRTFVKLLRGAISAYLS